MKEENENIEEPIESLEEDYNPQADEGIEESYPEEQEQTSSYNPQNRYRNNQEYHNRQYYKDRVNETNDKRDLAQKNADDARQKRSDAKENYKSAKSADDKDNKKAAKQEYKDAKKEDKQAQRDYRDARRDNRAAKFDQASDMFNRVAHPVDTAKRAVRQKIQDKNPINKVKQKAADKVGAVKDKAKEGAKNAVKKTGKAAANGAKAVGRGAVQGIAKLVASIPPPVWAGIGICLLLLIILLAVVVLLGDEDDEEMTNINTVTCAYQDMGGITDTTVVKIMNCDGTEEIETIALEKYVSGVALKDLGALYGTEITKAYLIVIRSNVLSSAINNTNSYEFDASLDAIKVRQCENVPYYWDYDKNLYQSETDSNLYSTEEQEGYKLIKPALADNDKILYEASANEVACMYLVDNNNKVTPSTLTVEQLSKKAADNAGTDNGNYPGLLLNGSTTASNVSTGKVEYNSYSGDVGDYAKWKQCDSRWGSIALGEKNVCSWGCLLVSMSMIVAHSGVDTGAITDFNPGTFIKAMKNAGVVNSSGNTSFNISSVIPNMSESTSYPKNDYSKIKQLADSGCFIILEVKTHCSGQHWVAVDSAASAKAGWTSVYIWDPGSSKDPTLDHYYTTKSGKKCKYNANTALCYKRTK